MENIKGTDPTIVNFGNDCRKKGYVRGYEKAVSDRRNRQARTKKITDDKFNSLLEYIEKKKDKPVIKTNQ